MSCNPAKPILDHNYRLSAKGSAFLQEREGFREYAYNDGTGYAIGFGNTFYENGERVQRGDRISRERANQLFEAITEQFEIGVNKAVKSPINQSQFDALVSYAYNRGLGSFRKTQLLIVVNNDPNDELIQDLFIREWGSNKKYKNALIRRRKMEAELYFSESIPEKTRWRWWEVVLIVLMLAFYRKIANFLISLNKWKISISKT